MERVTTSPPERDHAGISGGLLTIDLDALRANYRLLALAVAPAECGAVVKADAYGLGAARVVPVLEEAGCRTFFVAHLQEAIDLQRSLGRNTTVVILNGLQPGGEVSCAEAGFVPVLNSLEQVERWAALCRSRVTRLPAALQVDTGMSRLGLPPDEIDRLLDGGDTLSAIDVVLVMSHLASADEPDHAGNAAQRDRFRALLARLPIARASLANSGGVLLDPGFHHNVARPGIALHGVDPMPGSGHGLQPVVALAGRVIQVRTVPPGTSVGYGGTFVTTRSTRLATIAVGYADGWPRHLGGIGAAYVDGVRLPIVGRISMDSMTLDITALPDGRLSLGSFVELIGPHQTLDAVAREAGTIPYEILTSLGRRYARRYVGSVSS